MALGLRVPSLRLLHVSDYPNSLCIGFAETTEPKIVTRARVRVESYITNFEIVENATGHGKRE